MSEVSLVRRMSARGRSSMFPAIARLSSFRFLPGSLNMVQLLEITANRLSGPLQFFSDWGYFSTPRASDVDMNFSRKSAVWYCVKCTWELSTHTHEHSSRHHLALKMFGRRSTPSSDSKTASWHWVHARWRDVGIALNQSCSRCPPH